VETISDTRVISIELAQNSIARARHVVCHPVDRKPQGRQEEGEEEGRSRKKPDANKSTVERARASGSDKEKQERKREKEKELRKVSDCNMAPRLPPAMATRAK